MADKYIQFDRTSGLFVEKEATTTSAGAADAGKIIALNASGKLDNTMLPAGVGVESRTIVASEDLSAGDLVNIWNDAGTPKVRKADASNLRAAHGYVTEAVTSGSNATVYFDGVISGLTGLTVGAYYYLSDSVAGGISATPPNTANYYAQCVGYAVSDTELVFDPQMPIKLA